MTVQGRPDPALRIGITGARNLAAAELPRLIAQLERMLSAARENFAALATGPAYSDNAGVLHVISPLARGADRLAARVAVQLGYGLHVPMPFPQPEYEKDFDTPADLAEFRALLAAAAGNVVALDGDHGPEMDRAYEAVGRYVVHHCDVLIAIWDGLPGRGRGGTADIVRYATQVGVPVWWLHATGDRLPTWLADVQDLRDPLPSSMPAEAALKHFLAGLIPPPPAVRRHRHGVLAWLACLFQGRIVAPEAEYYQETPQGKIWFWRAYSGLMRFMSGIKEGPWIASAAPDDRVAGYWFGHYLPADGRSGEYAARYRSSYVWVFGLGTAALGFGAIATVLGLLHADIRWLDLAIEGVVLGATLAEFLALGLILALVLIGTRRDWHERSIEYRLLAELCRKQQVLAPLGWTLPITAVRNMTDAGPSRQDRAAWVAWLFAALSRAAPLPTGELAHAARGQPRQAVLTGLIDEQIAYHTDRAALADAAGGRFEQLGLALFGVVIVCVFGKLWTEIIHYSALAWPLGLLATVLPGISAASVGIRAYAELQLLAGQSRHMLHDLLRARARVERLDPTRALVSQDIAAEAASVATLMLQDLDGWARLFRVKGVEPG